MGDWPEGLQDCSQCGASVNEWEMDKHLAWHDHLIALIKGEK